MDGAHLKIVKLSLLFIILPFIQQCSDTFPREDCREFLSVFNFQGTYSRGNVCLIETKDESLRNLSCQALVYLNLACEQKPKIVYRAGIKIDINNNKEAENLQKGKNSGYLALILYLDLVERTFIRIRGDNLKDLLKFLVTKHKEQNALDGETKTVSCSLGGNATTRFVSDEFLVTFTACQFAVSESSITWNGSLQGTLTYQKLSSTYFLKRVLMRGNLVSMGSLNDKYIGAGSRSIDETCASSMDLIPNVSDSYTFCGKTYNYNYK